MLAPVQAVAAYLAAAGLARPQPEEVVLARAAGRVLAADVHAREAHPAAARSTMDGFALASADGGETRVVVAEIRMGEPPPRALARGEAMRIPTGGVLPAGADAVVPIEDVTDDGDRVTPHEAPRAGDCLAAEGSDLVRGALALAAGRRLGGPELGVLATLGYATVPVYRRPRVGILSTGDELVDPATAPLPLGRIRDSNRYALAAALEAMGAESVQLPRAADRAEALADALRDGFAAVDAIVTSGGSSVGTRDLVPPVVARLGSPGVVVHGLRVKPGKPTMLGAVGGRAVIGLPGNPASSLLILEAVLRPVLAALTGERGARPVAVRARAAAPFVGRAGWTHFVPARLEAHAGELRAVPLAIRSAQTSLLAAAAGYVVMTETRPRAEMGEEIDVQRFSCGGAPIGGPA